jgi:hypothetical protein
MGWQGRENKEMATPGAVISYTQAPMKHGLGRKKRCHGGKSSFQRNSGHDSRAACKAARQTAGKHGVASRGATLLTLTLSRFAAHRAPVLHRSAPMSGA